LGEARDVGELGGGLLQWAIGDERRN